VATERFATLGEEDAILVADTELVDGSERHTAIAVLLVTSLPDVANARFAVAGEDATMVAGTESADGSEETDTK
jgi:hypothetical protein